MLSLAVLAAAGAASASPVLTPRASAPGIVNAGLTRNVNKATTAQAEGLRLAARALAFEERAGVDGPNATNALVTYTVQIGTGTGNDSYRLVLDTGSAITWIGAAFADYKATPGAVYSGYNFSNTYGSGGTASGPLINDTITLAPGVNPKNMPIGNTTFGAGDENDHYWEDGILGVAPTIATTGKVVGHPEVELVTPVVAAYQQGLIAEALFGVYFAPTNKTQESFPDDIPASAHNGVITYGGVNTELTKSDVAWSPRTKVNGTAARGWGLDLLKLNFNNDTVTGPTISGIVDTGTTLTYLPTDLFQKYFDAIPGADIDPTGLLRFPNTSLPNVPDLEFVFPGGSIVFNKYAQLVPLWAYEDMGYLAGDHGDILYSWVGNWSRPSGQGYDFIIGQKTLERWYSAYDITGDKIGFAETKYTYPSTFPEQI